MKVPASILIAVSLASAGCSTTQEIMLAKESPAKSMKVVARATGDSNSEDMNKNVEDAFLAQGITVKPPLPAGTRKAGNVDGVVTYSDQWRWDLVMYLRGLNISIFDAASGDLIVSGQWHDSTLHGFRDSREVTRNLVADMLTKVNTAIPKP